MKRYLAICISFCLLLSMLAPSALAESETVITLKDGCIDIQGPGASADDHVVTITQQGTYILTGTLTAGQLIVDAGKKDDITLVLRQAEIINPDGAAILVSKADKVVLLLAEHTENRLISGAPVPITGTVDAADANGAALQAKAALTICGDGALFLGGYLHQGIRATKDLRIEGGSITIESIGAAIRCKDQLSITGGSLDILSGGDGIHAAEKASEATDTTEATEAQGFLHVSGGMVSITAFADGMQSDTTLEITGGILTITTSGGAANAPAHTNEFDMRGGPFGMRNNNAGNTGDDAVSTKALKSAGDMTISGGSITIDACDDALCARGDLLINSGSILAATGDDGLHADGAVTINGGSIMVTQSYEGIEGAAITINGGEISITSTDDGMNASNGSENGGWLNHFGGPGFGGSYGGPFNAGAVQSDNSSSELPVLSINGGSVWVNAQGDGLDSNGILLVTGGLVIVDGPDNSFNGALDSGTENGGYLRITGGTVLAIGASGMSETFDSKSEQAVLNAVTRWQPGDEIVISDAIGTELIRHSAARSGQSIIYSDATLIDKSVMTITIGSAVLQTTVGSSGSNSWGSFGGPGRR